VKYLRFLLVALLAIGAALATAAFAFSRGAAPATARETVRIHPRVHERWRVPIDADVVGLPASDQRGVVVTAGGSEVVAISRDGNLEWTTPVEGALANAPRIDGDRVFVAGKRVVFALNRDTGQVVWSAATTGDKDDNRANRPVVAADTVVFTTANGVTVGLDRATGSERWRLVLPTASTAEPAAGQSAAGSPVVVVVGIAQWWGLDPTTGATLWSGDLGVYGTSSPVVYPDGLDLVAAVASDEHVFAVDARTGAPRWDATADQSELFQVPVVADNGNELLVPDHWGRLTAYNPYDGRRLWSARGPDTSAEFGEPVLVADRLVALPLDGHGPRLASPRGSFRLRPPVDGFGVGELGGGGRQLVVTTAGKPRNYVLLYDVG
jgi:outer membrane protein assembly factor BamB